MPQLTVKEIQENPREFFISTKEWPEQIDLLKELFESNPVSVLTALLITCSQKEIRDLFRQTNRLNVKAYENQPDSPYAIMTKALKVADFILRLKNPEDETCHEACEEGFDIDAFNQFSGLVCQLVKPEDATSIAEKLALYTPVNDRNAVVKALKQPFSSTNLPKQLGKAMLVAGLLDALTGDTPLSFFNSEDYSEDLLHEFDGLVRKRLENKVEAIAPKLSGCSLNELSKVTKQLSMITPKTDHQPHPFNALRGLLQKESRAKNKQTVVENRNGLFNGPSQDAPTQQGHSYHSIGSRGKSAEPKELGCCNMF